MNGEFLYIYEPCQTFHKIRVEDIPKIKNRTDLMELLRKALNTLTNYHRAVVGVGNKDKKLLLIMEKYKRIQNKPTLEDISSILDTSINSISKMITQCFYLLEQIVVCMTIITFLYL